MNETVFVVLGESGEWSDRDVWVSGVFWTREEAQHEIVKRLALRREYETWHEKYCDVLYAAAAPRYSFQLSDAELEEAQRIAREKAGDAPPYEEAERAEIFEVEIGSSGGVWDADEPINRELSPADG